MSGKALDLTVGWYGKLPGVGDFASRGVSRQTLDILDNWMQDGLTTLEQRTGEWLTPFLHAPVWNMILPAGKLSQRPMIGCIGPSCDRVGRGFPLTLLLSGPESLAFRSLIAQSSDWLTGTREILRQAIERKYLPDQLDQQLRQLTEIFWSARTLPQVAEPVLGHDILDVIGQPVEDDAVTIPLASGILPWPELASTFLDQNDLSYWWATPTPDFPGAIPVIHRGPLDAKLFSRLFSANGANIS